ERAVDETARLNRRHGGADFFHDTDVLVSHRQVVDGLGATVGPQVGPQMQVAASRMIASVGSMILGSSRSSTRTSPGECMTTPLMYLLLPVLRSDFFSRRSRRARSR